MLKRPVNLLLVLTCLQYDLGQNLISAARGPIQDAIQSGAAAEYNRDECPFRREFDSRCPDPDINVYLYKFGKERLKLENSPRNWIDNDLYDPQNDNVILIHGYNGGDGALPVVILRDTYLKNGSYNVFMVDWGALGAAPCYPAAVANLRFVGNCIASTIRTLKDLGMSIPRTTCIGHSLGAHLCGIMSNYLPFRLPRIIGMDPAKPLVRPGKAHRLDSGDADFVQVLHTNAGYFGDNVREGHVDFCANGGKDQPFCEYADKDKLCSHNWSICYVADSIDGKSDIFAEPCSGRCPPSRRIGPRSSDAMVIGQHTPAYIKGSFCVTAIVEPYCPKSDGDRGDKRCCV